MKTISERVLTILAIFGLVASADASDFSHTALTDAVTGSTVTGKCASTSNNIWTDSLDVNCVLRRNTIVEASKIYNHPINANSSVHVENLSTSRHYNCLYCTRNESKYRFRCAICEAQSSMQACEGSGYPPPGGDREMR